MTTGFIGTGLMGLPMVERLAAAGVPLMVYNRTAERAQPLADQGVAIATSPTELLQICDPVIVMLSNAAAIQAVLLSEEAKPLLAGRTVIQMSTISPSESQALQADIGALGGDYLEAPVLGSIPEVKAGKLQVMVGGSVAQFERWRSLFQNFGSTLIHVGEVGSASALKLALNQLIASLTTAFGLSLAFVQSHGVEVETFMQILRQSALYAPTFDKKLERLLAGNFANPNFPTKHMLKDTNLFLTEAIAAGLRVDSLEGVRQILAIACEQGLADADYSALFAALKPASE
jgi:3-hydroxyisobutyrate dehydrogenase